MEDILQIKKADAVTAFRSGSDADKKLLKNLFPSEFGNLTDRIKAFQDVLDELGLKEEDVLPKIPSAMKHLEKHLHAAAKLMLIVQLFRGDWVPDWSNPNQYKYYPWFEHVSGVGLSSYGFDGAFSDASVAARLCLPTADLARYVGKTFESIYRDFLTF